MINNPSAEAWRDVPGYEGLYMVSNKGRVKSLNYHREHREKVIAQRTDRYGYKAVNLSKDGNAKQLNVHKLVASAFIPNPQMLPLINHKDENRTNNSAENLEWCTPKYNSNYGTCREKLQGINAKPVVQIDAFSGKEIYWQSATVAARQLNANRRTLARAVATGKRYMNSFWEFGKVGAMNG